MAVQWAGRLSPAEAAVAAAAAAFESAQGPWDGWGAVLQDGRHAAIDTTHLAAPMHTMPELAF